MARGAGGPSLELLGDPFLIPQNASYTHSPVKREACPKCVEFGVVWSPRQTWSPVFSDLSFNGLDFRSSQRLVRINSFGQGSPEEAQLSCSCFLVGVSLRDPGAVQGAGWVGFKRPPAHMLLVAGNSSPVDNNCSTMRCTKMAKIRSRYNL